MTTKKDVVKKDKVEETPVDATPVDASPDETPAPEVELVPDEASAAKEIPATKDSFMQAKLSHPTASLRVRLDPSMKGAVVTKVPHKTKFKVIDNTNPEWVFVELDNGVKGFVNRPFVTEV